MILGLPDEENLLSHAYMIDGDVDTDVECLQEYFLRLFGIEDIYQSVDSFTLVAQAGDLFNSDATEEEFLAQQKVCREKAQKSIAYLIRRIKKQEFNEEQPIAE